MSVVDIVVARYDEDTTWIWGVVDALAGDFSRVRLHVYDKGLTDFEFPANVNENATRKELEVIVWRLPNVGRESHTYLDHIQRRRSQSRQDKMAGSESESTSEDVTVFVQGNISDHTGSATDVAFVQGMVAASRVQGMSDNHACHAYGNNGAVPYFRVAMYPGAGDSRKCYRDWFETYICKWPSHDIRWFQNGLFAVHTSRLLSKERTDDFYTNLKSQVAWHVNPEAGHYMERSWYYVFPCERQKCC